mmetsp:Transcript_3488/g.12585  ORF Transcript_3488/g.12585 Transcript_3488/m.12585 type:complete len:211 (+) Transcript_3488:152-784(+)
MSIWFLKPEPPQSGQASCPTPRHSQQAMPFFLCVESTKSDFILSEFRASIVTSSLLIPVPSHAGHCIEPRPLQRSHTAPGMTGASPSLRLSLRSIKATCSGDRPLGELEGVTATADALSPCCLRSRKSACWGDRPWLEDAPGEWSAPEAPPGALPLLRSRKASCSGDSPPEPLPELLGCELGGAKASCPLCALFFRSRNARCSGDKPSCW